jgi:hypothetical protein
LELCEADGHPNRLAETGSDRSGNRHQLRLAALLQQEPHQLARVGLRAGLRCLPVEAGRQLVPPKPKKDEPADPAAKPTEANAVVAWTNEYGPNKTRIFSTTLGHNNDTVADDRYLDLVTRGLLWAAGKLGDDGAPAPGLALEAK